MAMRSTRPYQHAKIARRSPLKTHLLNWIRSLQNEGREPAVLILEQFTERSSRRFVGQIEKIYIEVLRLLGHQLTNIAEGGHGGATTTGRKHSTETLAKMRKPKSAEARLRMSLAKKGKPKGPPSLASRAKSSATQKGRPGRVWSEASKLKLSKTLTGRKHTAEARKRMSEAQMGHSTSEKTRAAVAESNRKRARKKC